MGKPIREARNTSTSRARRRVHPVVRRGSRQGLRRDRADPDATPCAMITREPLGVVGAVVPWNFPLLMASWKLAPALAAGNSVVLKPAEQSPLTALRLGRARRRGRAARGRPQRRPGLRPAAGPGARPPHRRRLHRVHRLDRGRQAVPALRGRVEHEARVARVRRQEPEHRLRRLPRPRRRRRAAAACGIFFNQGEVCTAGSRLVVARADPGRVHGTSCRGRARHRARRPARPGHDARRDRRPDADRARPRLHRDRPRRRAPTLVLGGSRVRADTGGFYIEPTVFDRVRNDMRSRARRSSARCWRRSTSDAEAEAIAVANDTMYGLAAAVWTDDVDAAHRVARAIRAGSVWVNTLRRRRHHEPVRRLQAVRVRPRQVAPRAREVHRPEDGLDRVAGLAAGRRVPPSDRSAAGRLLSDRSARAVHHLTAVQVARPRGDVAR